MVGREPGILTHPSRSRCIIMVHGVYFFLMLPVQCAKLMIGHAEQPGGLLLIEIGFDQRMFQ